MMRKEQYLLELSVACKHVVQIEFCNGLRKHTNKDLVFALCLALRGADLNWIHSLMKLDWRDVIEQIIFVEHALFIGSNLTLGNLILS